MIIDYCINNIFESVDYFNFFYRFPSDIRTKQKWIEIVNRPDWFPNPNTTICSVHFEDECFVINSKGTRRLFPSSIPTLFLAEKVFFKL